MQDLLNVSRGRTQSLEVCRLREVAAAACEALASTAEAQKVRIALEIPADIELPLERSRMERAFSNLIGNALEAMPDGGSVRVTARVEDGAAVVDVADKPVKEAVIRARYADLVLPYTEMELKATADAEGMFRLKRLPVPIYLFASSPDGNVLATAIKATSSFSW